MLPGVSALVPRHDALLLDLWGVVHNGKRLYPGVLDCLYRLKAGGVRVLFLSNAPRPESYVLTQLLGLGIPESLHDGVVTSGDVARAALMSRPDEAHRKLGHRFYHLGPYRDHGAYEGLDDRGYVMADSAADADFILCTGLVDDDTETAANYAGILAVARGRDLPLLCLNPDHTVIRGDKEIPCAGVLADAYVALGGRVLWYGKPHASAYVACRERLAGIAPDRIAAIGDRLDTDIAGARQAGLDAYLVTGGVLASRLGVGYGEAPKPENLAKILAGEKYPPTGILAGLVW
ncbi:MAG: TIGR01459 family HAD-type hydrolase [Alphaproteobacteria bacterium]|nr:TIGR01459 family HAD-type hydrolase [Alphaproteobacteria bacterium]